MSRHDIPEFPKAMVVNGVDPIDILILNKLYVGKSKTTLAEELKKDFGIEIKRSEIEKRIEKMTERGVIVRTQTIIVNPVKLFDHVFLNWLKLPLRPLLRRDELTWTQATEKIIGISKKYGKMIMTLFTPEGEGEYDLVAFVCTNDLPEYYRFLEELTREELLEKSKTQRVHSPSMVYFDPVIIPLYEECREALILHKKKLADMRIE